MTITGPFGTTGAEETAPLLLFVETVDEFFATAVFEGTPSKKNRSHLWSLVWARAVRVEQTLRRETSAIAQGRLHFRKK
jgi:hypothetical protein